jgi:hypothetical protein
MKTITKIIYPASAAFALACFTLLPIVQAVSPAPDGGYFNGNTAEGQNALLNTNGVYNTAIGYTALSSINGGDANTATGAFALAANTTGGANTATGESALGSNIMGGSNTATGYFALYTNNGTDNTATGVKALYLNTTGLYNTATGASALQSNRIGGYNTANGLQALRFNTSGNYNTAEGAGALFSNSTGSNNTALGFEAGLVTTGSNNIDIGNLGGGGPPTIRIGVQGTQMATYVAGISGIGVDGSQVYVNSSGQLGVIVSSARFKQNIQAMGDASDALLALRPVTFRYKHEIDPDGIPQFGLVAEEVEKVNPDLVGRDAQGKVFTVRYEAVNAMLLNEFLKEHRKVEEMEATVAQQQNGMEALTAQLKKQAAQIQKVSAQIEVGKTRPQVVLNNP